MSTTHNHLNFLLISCVCLLSACQTLPPTFERKPDSSIVYTPARWSFPNTVAGFSRASVLSYNQDGSDCSVAYNHESLIAATVYIYPSRGRTTTQEIQAVSGTIEQLHGSGPAKKRSVASFHGYSGVRLGHSYSGVFANQAQSLRSQTLLFPIGERFLKFRITYPESNAAEAELRINSFLEQFPWPKRG